MLDKILDASIYFSFDKSGFLRHEKDFDPISKDRLIGKRILITGGTSGIGAALAERLIENGANVIVTGRCENRFNDRFDNNHNIKFVKNDLANFFDVIELAKNIQKIDCLVCNAGGMPNDLEIINDSYDSIFASQVVGHYILIRAMIERKRFGDQPIITINSSGGMYPVKLVLDDLKWESRKYDKVESYAIAKRAQVILSRELSLKYPDYHFSCSHPGWVDTPGLEVSLPRFWKFTKNRLRDQKQGSDTLFFLCANGYDMPNGKFWFDRKIRDPYLIPGKKEDSEQHEKLELLLDSAYIEVSKA